MDELLAPEEWLHHERESWVWLLGRFVPYPFQNNLRRLPREAMWDCVRGLIELWRRPPRGAPADFAEWARQTFGEGVCRHFMEPYNFKVWAHPLETLAHGWIGDRVAVTDLERVLENILFERDDVSWGPNQTFRFPLRGGTGEVWRRCARRLPAERLAFGARVERIDTERREIVAAGADEPIRYESLITTMPLDLFVARSDLAEDAEAARCAALLRHSSTHIIGLGVAGRPPEALATKCWMYFPESDCPFYRATVFSNYSPNNVPDIDKGWSLMCEVSESPFKPVDAGRVVEETIAGALATGLIEDRARVVHSWHRRLERGYPTPTIDRDRALAHLLPRLAERGVYSRGRFGAWKYEVANQDHSFMQGVECVDRIVSGADEVTVERPEIVNRARPRGARSA
jgi:protoporphyrinogen oxidase